MSDFKTRDYLEYFGFTFVEDKNWWIDKHGCYVYDNNVPEKLLDFVNIMTGTAYAKGFNKAKLSQKPKKNVI